MDIFNLIKLGGATTIIIIVAFVIIFGLAFWWNITRIKRKQKAMSSAAIFPVAPAVLGRPDKQPGKKSLIGTGAYKAMVYRYNNSIDFTTIPEPIGNIYQFDTSCPFSGGGYIVKETKEGRIADYDPREVKIITEELPEWAWFAINCRDIVRQFWKVPIKWWASVSMWFAAGMMLVVFIAFLAVFGG